MNFNGIMKNTILITIMNWESSELFLLRLSKAVDDRQKLFDNLTGRRLHCRGANPCFCTLLFFCVG